MIIDIQKFIKSERSYWNELEATLKFFESEPARVADIEKLKRFHYLYERTSGDLARIATFSSERQLRHYLESLVARAYGEIHESRESPKILTGIKNTLMNFPCVFRKYIRAFTLSCLIMFSGTLLGGFALTFDHEAKEILMPFDHLRQSPSERVAQEESVEKDRLAERKGTFSSMLITHNTRVSILTLSLGISYGIGTILVLFNNGVMLGAVSLDYILAGQGMFLSGWLLPHGIVEIPAILIAGQAGLILGGAMIGWGESLTMAQRLRKISKDMITLICGVTVMLIWAGFIEAFFSQYHEPVISYEVKIGFGIIEMIVLFYILAVSGKGRIPSDEPRTTNDVYNNTP